MSVDREKFLEWAEEKFDYVKSSSKDIKLNSIFTEDHKGHLWCDPDGGKKQVEFGAYQCWKTKKKGTLVGLVMLVEKCSFQYALEILGIRSDLLVEADKVLMKLFGDENSSNKKIEELDEDEKINKGIRLPSKTVNIKSLPKNNIFRIKAEVFLSGRKINLDNLMVCFGKDDPVWEDRYYEKIIIPYFNKQGELIYFNSRDLSGSKNALRYLGPTYEEVGVGKGDVFYFSKWPKKESIVFLTEGEFCSIALTQIGFDSGAFGGSNLSDEQIDILKENKLKIILANDNDGPGIKSRYNMIESLIVNGYREDSIFYISPAESYKDWNDMYIDVEKELIVDYIKENIKPIDLNDLNLL